MLLSNNNTNSAVINIDISSKLGSEYVVMFDDISRMVLIQLTIQLMFYMSNPEHAFFTDDFMLLILYIVLGVCLYWLVFKNLIKFQ
jgi:hypothetical protein